VITWALTHIPQLIFLFVVVQVIRAAMRAAQLSQAHKAGTTETDDQKRVREIQERIRKIVAERRGGAAATETQPERPPLLRPSVAPLDPFGGPSRRLVIETTRRAAPQPVEPSPTEGAILERQQQLADQMRALEQAREQAARRAAQAVEGNLVTARAAVAAEHRAGWLKDLRDPQSLRRAFVLREVLGEPVAFR
jgi:hypothetical protein